MAGDNSEEIKLKEANDLRTFSQDIQVREAVVRKVRKQASPTVFAVYLREAPSTAGRQGNCKGGLEGLVGQLQPLVLTTKPL